MLQLLGLTKCVTKVYHLICFQANVFLTVAGGEGPNSVLIEVRLKIGQGNMVLEGEEKLKIVRAGMQSLTLIAHKYPETLGVSLSLDGVGLLSPEGTIARAGQELEQEDSDTALDSGAYWSLCISKSS